MKEKTIKEYMAYRGIECKNQSALTNYERYITAFLSGANNTLTNLDEAYLTNHINEVSEKFSQTSLNNIKPLFKNFIKWKFPDYPTRFRNLDKLCKTKRAKATYQASQMLSEKEVKKLIAGETDLFWKVFWLVFFYGGFRPIDTVRLRWDMFKFDKDGETIITTVIQKNKRTFVKIIPKEVTPLIKKWRTVNLSDWVFPSMQGDHPIHSKTPNQRLSKLSMKVLGKHINPYILRHSIATILYPDGDENVVANQMGHSKSMKETYEHLDEKGLIKRAKKVWTTKEEMPEEERITMQKQIDDLKFFKRQTQYTMKQILEGLTPEQKKKMIKVPVKFAEEKALNNSKTKSKEDKNNGI